MRTLIACVTTGIVAAATAAVGLVAHRTEAAPAPSPTADRWAPWEYQGPAFFKYRVEMGKPNQRKSVFCSFDVRATEEKDAAGKPLVRVTTTTESLMPESEVKGSAIFAGNANMAMLPMMMFGNAMFAGLIGQSEMEVGKETDFYGSAKVKCVKKETIAGIEGYLLELHTKQGDQFQKISELVVDPKLSMPLRSCTFGGNDSIALELVEYKKH
ncbi:MAG: hypothetical protein KDC38_09235 [Planctomycetes bacterium]|nr:hypothetical protein [Planctomycetota bacterium]